MAGAWRGDGWYRRGLGTVARSWIRPNAQNCSGFVFAVWRNQAGYDGWGVFDCALTLQYSGRLRVAARGLAANMHRAPPACGKRRFEWPAGDVRPECPQRGASCRQCDIVGFRSADLALVVHNPERG